MSKKYKPCYPTTFDEAVKMLVSSKEESAGFNTEFLKGYRFGMNMGINTLIDLKRNMEQNK